MFTLRTLYLASVWLHIIAAMIWIGGMAVVVLAVMPNVRRLDEPHRARFMYAFIGRFRAVMWIAFAVVAATGFVNLWARGIRLSHVLSSDWRATPLGSIITAKIALFLFMAAVAVVHERVRKPAGARWLGRLALAIGLVMVLLAVLLVRGA